MIRWGQAPFYTPLPSGMAMMILSIALVTGLSAFCLWRILREEPPGDHHHTRPKKLEGED